jgi:hypothetical protein
MLAVSCETVKLVSPSGCITWKLAGRLHREDGPAFIYKGREEWWLHGKTHRIGGPAIHSSDGRPGYWFIHGVEYSEEDYNMLTFFGGIC